MLLPALVSSAIGKMRNCGRADHQRVKRGMNTVSEQRFLADHTIGRALVPLAHYVVCLSVCRRLSSSVTFCIVAKRCVLAKNCLKE